MRPRDITHHWALWVYRDCCLRLLLELTTVLSPTEQQRWHSTSNMNFSCQEGSSSQHGFLDGFQGRFSAFRDDDSAAAAGGAIRTAGRVQARQAPRKARDATRDGLNLNHALRTVGR